MSDTEQGQGRVRPGDRLTKPRKLREQLDISPMTEWRRRQTDPEFPQPISTGDYIQREIDEYIAILASRPAPARRAPRRASAPASAA